MRCKRHFIAIFVSDSIVSTPVYRYSDRRRPSPDADRTDRPRPTPGLVAAFPFSVELYIRVGFAVFLYRRRGRDACSHARSAWSTNPALPTRPRYVMDHSPRWCAYERRRLTSAHDHTQSTCLTSCVWSSLHERPPSAETLPIPLMSISRPRPLPREELEKLPIPQPPPPSTTTRLPFEVCGRRRALGTVRRGRLVAAGIARVHCRRHFRAVVVAVAVGVAVAAPVLCAARGGGEIGGRVGR